MLFVSLRLLSSIYLWTTLQQGENSAKTSFNTILRSHLHLWVLTLIAPFSAVAHLSFAFTENLNISLDLYCLSLVVIHATVNFTFMICMQPINFECLAMAISL